MSIWLALWILISLALLGFLAWSLYVLHQQKTVWKKFAAENKLRYKKNETMQSPEMEGTIGKYKISFFTSEHQTPDARAYRKLTAIEVPLENIMPSEFGVASGGMIPVLKTLNFRTEVQPKSELWSKANMAVGENSHALKAYLTEERIAILTKMMRIKNTWVILICRKDRMLLRLDTANPLSSTAHLDKISKIMLQAAKILEVSGQEMNILKAEASREVVTKNTIVIEESKAKDDDVALAFELEEDENEIELSTEELEDIEETTVEPVEAVTPKKPNSSEKPQNKTKK